MPDMTEGRNPHFEIDSPGIPVQTLGKRETFG